MRPLLVLLLSASVSVAQQAAPAKAARSSAWFNAQSVDFAALTAGPPTVGSKMDRQDMQDVLMVQRTRTAAEVRQAQADDKEEDIFAFRQVFGQVLAVKFDAAELPLTAALSQHLREASSAINPALKIRFNRPRPFVVSAQVHPVCGKTDSNSFPSGHGMVGTLEALALTQIVPARSPEILARLDEYMHDRVVCGVHYPSDLVASRAIATSLFGLISASPSFQKELADARDEVRSRLGLSLGAAAGGAFPTQERDYLANNTVLIVRHAEKPPEIEMKPGLTDKGRHRAQAYVQYFQPFHEAGVRLKVSALYAGADSASSIRPRLTMEPLSKASGMALDTSISTKDPEGMVALLETHAHGDTPLICWRHGQIPALLKAFGAQDSLIPDGKWPDEVYDWVVVLHFDAKGKLDSQKLLHETLLVK